MGAALAALGAALGAASLGLVELTTSLDKPLSWRATHWVLLRVGVDALLGLIAYPFLLAATNGSIVAAILLGSLAGPAVLRAQVITVNRTLHMGPAAIEPLLKKIDDTIDDIGAVAQSAWVNGQVLTAIQAMPVDEVRNRAIAYVRGVRRFKQADLTRIENFINNTANDANSDDDTKRRFLVEKLLDLKGRRLVASIARAARQR